MPCQVRFNANARKQCLVWSGLMLMPGSNALPGQVMLMPGSNALSGQV